MNNKRKNKVERELYKNIGNRLLLERRERHYTQEQMAELIGVSTGFYGMIERGEKAPSIERLVLIYEKLGTDITYLLTGDEKDERLANYIEKCPQEKQYDFEQLMRHALKLADFGEYHVEK
ncbi:MAG: helix-turn-helix domain-containing protein [Lachnospiraceae bacterium]|nr:helix-turn-helix domain-containing protein [Lachnospiraceae bacterium]MDE7029892.1 helix-turn-helix domain-containing protein [Lachnospiraceae bacterium]